MTARGCRHRPWLQRFSRWGRCASPRTSTGWALHVSAGAAAARQLAAMRGWVGMRVLGALPTWRACGPQHAAPASPCATAVLWMCSGESPYAGLAPFQVGAWRAPRCAQLRAHPRARPRQLPDATAGPAPGCWLAWLPLRGPACCRMSRSPCGSAGGGQEAGGGAQAGAAGRAPRRARQPEAPHLGLHALGPVRQVTGRGGQGHDRPLGPAVPGGFCACWLAASCAKVGRRPGHDCVRLGCHAACNCRRLAPRRAHGRPAFMHACRVPSPFLPEPGCCLPEPLQARGMRGCSPAGRNAGRRVTGGGAEAAGRGIQRMTCLGRAPAAAEMRHCYVATLVGLCSSQVPQLSLKPSSPLLSMPRLPAVGGGSARFLNPKPSLSPTPDSVGPMQACLAPM